jgi:hypothetical protein
MKKRIKEKEQQTEQTFKEEELRDVIKAKIIQYMMQNEVPLILKTLTSHLDEKEDDIDYMLEKLAKAFVGIRKGIVDISIRINDKKKYGYDTDDIDISEVEIREPYFNPLAEIDLPNGVRIGWVEITSNNEQFLQRENCEAVQKYKEELKKVSENLKEAIKQM